MTQFHTLVASDLDGTLLPEGQTELPCAVFDEIRRLHDCGFSGWWVFPAIVPPICFFVMCWAPDPAQPNKYGTTERLPSKNLREQSVPPLIDGIEYLTPPPQPYEPAVKRREELFEKEQQEIIEQEKVPNSKETQNEKDIRQTGQKD